MNNIKNQDERVLAQRRKIQKELDMDEDDIN